MRDSSRQRRARLREKEIFLSTLQEADRKMFIEAEIISDRSQLWFENRNEMLRCMESSTDKKWGFLIIRSIYGPGSDSRFLAAMTKFDQWLYAGLLNVYNHKDRLELAQKIFAGYENTIIDDVSLQDLDIEETLHITKQFLAWHEVSWLPFREFSDSTDHYNASVIVFDESVLEQLEASAGKLAEQIESIKWSDAGSPKVDVEQLRRQSTRDQEPISRLWEVWHSQSVYPDGEQDREDSSE